MPTSAEPTHRLELRGDLTLRTCAATHQALCDALPLAETIIVDLTHTEDSDLSLVQLLLAAQRSAIAAGKTLRLAQPLPAPVLADLQRGGFLETGRKLWTQAG